MSSDGPTPEVARLPDREDHALEKEHSMKAFTRRHRHPRAYILSASACAGLIAFVGVLCSGAGHAAGPGSVPGGPGVPYARMPSIAPIGVRVHKYAEVPDSAKGPDVDPVKGYRTQKLGERLYMITDGSYQSMFMIYEDGVVVVDAPPQYASRIRPAIAEVTDRPITHLVYSHFHVDHIGGARSLGGHPIIIAHAETNRFLAREKDANRPLAAVTFDKEYRLSVGSQVLELSYRGSGHVPGNIFIYAPKQRTLMVVDVIFPGWMPWRRFAVAQDVPAYFAQVREISKWDFDVLVGGHVARTGTRADVAMQLAFMEDLKTAAATALKTTKPGEGVNPSDRGNPWAVFDQYIDRVVVECVNQLTPKWSTRLAAYDVYIWDQCYSMEQSLRID
jgi:glyoxylase-like metal-dependent hydrolase (beta-lactamase superfamily II)